MSESSISPAQAQQILQSGLPLPEFKNRKVLLIVPDHTRTAPVGQMFQEVHAWLGSGSETDRCDGGTGYPSADEPRGHLPSTGSDLGK